MALEYELKWFNLKDTEGGGGSSIPLATLTVSVNQYETYTDFLIDGILNTFNLDDNDDPITGEAIYRYDSLHDFVYITNSVVSGTDLVNCTLEKAEPDDTLYTLVVTDPTKDSSATVVLQGWM